ncbi:MAG: ankyrin repeat domain-containing protein [Thaumarchaeota archaeon]|nr:ankyrin repeat domain-containing protein [Nitrososphaerota archaeon]
MAASQVSPSETLNPGSTTVVFGSALGAQDEGVREFVIAGHRDLEKVRRMLGESPSLLNAAYQWSQSDSETAIQGAAQVGNAKIAEFLLERGAPLDICTAAMLGWGGDVRRIISEDAGQVMAKGAHGIPLLTHAAYSGDVDLVRFLYEKGAKTGTAAALHNAVSRGHVQVAEWLLENANPELGWKDFQGKTALEAAVAQRRDDMIALLETYSGSKGEHVRRFEGRADAYSKYRPKYPRGVVDSLAEVLGFDPGWVVADVGSGTGILSEVLLGNGNKVYCVEPNKDMRRAAEESLKGYIPMFVSVAGRAEATGLDAGSVDLVTVGQALHWFDPKGARREFKRILRSQGSVAVVYNHRRSESQAEKAYSDVIEKFERGRAEIPDVDDEYVADFLKNKGFKKFVIANSQSLDADGVLGRLASASYMPSPGSPEWVGVGEAVRNMFGEHGKDGVVTLRYDTLVYVGKIS